MSQPPIRILRRPSQQTTPKPKNVQCAAPSKSLEQREADYAAARRRIMGSESEDPEVTVPADKPKPVVADATLETTGSDGRGQLSNTNSPSDQRTQTTKQLPTATTTTATTKAIPLMSIPTSARPIPPSLKSPYHSSVRGSRPPVSRQITSTASAPLLSAYSTPPTPQTSTFAKTPPHQLTPSQPLDMSVIAAQQLAFMRQYQQTLAACQMLPQSQMSPGFQQVQFQGQPQTMFQPPTSSPTTTSSTQAFPTTPQAGFTYSGYL